MILAFAIAVQVLVSSAQISRTEAEAPKIRAAFDREMLDYPTARFRDVHVTVNLAVEEPRGAYLCGFVNGKNRMGAYTGWQRFMASGAGDAGQVHIETSDGNAVSDMLIGMTCGDAGSHASDPLDRSAWLASQ